MLIVDLEVRRVETEHLILRPLEPAVCRGCAHRLLGQLGTAELRWPRRRGAEPPRVGTRLRLGWRPRHYYAVLFWAYGLPLGMFLLGVLAAPLLPLAWPADLLSLSGGGLGLLVSLHWPQPGWAAAGTGADEAGILVANPVVAPYG